MTLRTRPREKVGELRPSQLLFTFGVGATVELPRMAVVVLGLESWETARTEEVIEPRLLAAVRAVVGSQVRELRTPPSLEEDSPEARRVGVPVAVFPRQLRCPSCELLASAGSGVFELKTNPYRPEQTGYVHPGCGRNRKAVPVNPARFLAACPAGHLDDFPWHFYLHQGAECDGTLRLSELGPAGIASELLLSCDKCGKRQSMARAFDRDESANLGPCRGRHPHLRGFETCNEELRPILLGASNSWFAVRLSLLSIPGASDPLADAVRRHWEHLQEAESAREVQLLIKSKPEFANYLPQAIWEKLEQLRAQQESDDSDPVLDVRAPEWRLLSDPAQALGTRDFLLRAVESPAAYAQWLDSVVLAERLREVHALLGFTRLESPEEYGPPDQVPEDRWVRLASKPPVWLPAVEVRGEGIFLRLREEEVTDWCAEPAVLARERELWRAHFAWRQARRIPNPDRGFPGTRYVLLHSLAHALMRRLSLECGYSASSLRERIYSREPNEDGGPMAGVLIYTAAPDAEGTLGGLVSLGDPTVLGRHLDQCLEAMRLCGSDPLCAEHIPDQHGLDLHGASCHACLFAPETSCERGNKYLDRSLLVDTLDTGARSFFRRSGEPPLPPTLPPTLPVSDQGLEVLSLVDLRPCGSREVDLPEGLATEGLFLAQINGNWLDRMMAPGTWCLFRRLRPEDPRPEADTLVIVREPDRLREPVTVRRFDYSERTNADGEITEYRVVLRARSSDLSIVNQTFTVPVEEWEGWRPFAVFVQPAEKGS